MGYVGRSPTISGGITLSGSIPIDLIQATTAAGSLVALGAREPPCPWGPVEGAGRPNPISDAV